MQRPENTSPPQHRPTSSPQQRSQPHHKVELPHGSGRQVTLDEVGIEIGRRLSRIFLRDGGDGGRRPVFGDESTFQNDPHWRDHVLFYEYFGAGIGASHQTGWTALVAMLL